MLNDREFYFKKVFSIFLINQITYFDNITSITFNLHKNGLSHLRAIFQSDKNQNILIIIAPIYRTKWSDNF